MGGSPRGGPRSLAVTVALPPRSLAVTVVLRPRSLAVTIVLRPRSLAVTVVLARWLRSWSPRLSCGERAWPASEP